MTEAEAQALVAALAPGARVAACTPLVGGVSAITHALTWVDADGRATRVVVRRPGPFMQADPGVLAREARLLELARAHGVPVPAVVAIDASGARLGVEALVVEHIDGEATFAPDDVVAYGGHAARALAAIHRIAAPLPEPDLLPAPRAPTAPEADPAGEAPELAAARAVVAAWSAWHEAPTRLRHGDFWPGNLLWRDGRLLAVIDWEDARLGDPLADVAVTRLDLLWLFGRVGMDAFTAAYGAVAPLDAGRLAHWDLVAALRPGDALPVWAPVYAAKGRPDVTVDTMHAGRRWLAADALARLGHGGGR